MPHKRDDLRARLLFSGGWTGGLTFQSHAVRLATPLPAGGPRPAKPSPAQHRPRAPGSCADAIRTYCATPPRGARSHRTASPGPAHAGRGCVGGAQRRPHAQCALWQRRRAGSWGRDRRRENRALRDVRRRRGMTFRRGRGGAAWRDPLRGKRGRVATASGREVQNRQEGRRP